MKKEIIIIIKNRNNLSRTISIYFLLLQLLFLTYTSAQQTSNGSPPPDYYGYNPKFNPSMAIMVVVLISVFFFLGFFSIYLRECIGDRTNREPSNRGSARTRRSSRRGRRGLDPEIIEKFPIFVYSDVKGLKLGKGALECAVCLNEFEDDDTLRLLPKCDHVFHPDCIDAWLVAHVTCPVCRSNLNPESMESAAEEEANTAENAGDVPAAHEATDRHEGGMTETDNHVTIINVAADEQDHDHPSQPDVINPSEIPNQNRSGSTRPNAIAGKFPRSHSTGHSLVQPGENCERFTLRLPEDVRKRIVTGKLNRSTSCLALPTGDGSARGGEGSSKGGRSYYYRGVRSERWVFSRTPPFFSRNSSTVPLSSKVTDGDGSTSGGSKGLRNSVKAPFDCLGGKAEGSEESSSSVRPPV